MAKYIVQQTNVCVNREHFHDYVTYPQITRARDCSSLDAIFSPIIYIKLAKANRVLTFKHGDDYTTPLFTNHEEASAFAYILNRFTVELVKDEEFGERYYKVKSPLDKRRGVRPTVHTMQTEEEVNNFIFKATTVHFQNLLNSRIINRLMNKATDKLRNVNNDQED